MGRILDRAPPHSDLATIYPSTPPSLPGGAVTWRGHSMSAFLRWDHRKSAFRSLPRARAAVESRWSNRNGLLGAAQALCLLVVAVIAALVVASLRAAPPKRAHSAATLYRRMGSGVSLSTLPLRSRMDGRMDGRMGWTPPDPFRKPGAPPAASARPPPRAVMDAVAAAWDSDGFVALLGKLVGEAKHLQNGAGATPTEDRGASHAKRMLDAR